MVLRLSVACLFSLWMFGNSASADLIIFSEGVVATPTASQAKNGNWFVATSLGPVNHTGWDDVLTLTMRAQGFVIEKGWILLNDYVSLAEDASIRIGIYKTHASDQNGGAMMIAKIGFGSTEQPENGIFHWLQLVQTNKPIAANNSTVPFWYNIGIAPGFWQLDNGQKRAGEGTDPFYHIVPLGALTLVDEPNLEADPASYANFWSIPAWEIPQDDGSTVIRVSSVGIRWGVYDPPGDVNPVPAPPALLLVALGLPMLSVLRLRGNRKS